jgi:hypothetical protein
MLCSLSHQQQMGLVEVFNQRTVTLMTKL